MKNIYVVKEKVPTLEQRNLIGTFSLQTQTKLDKALKGTSNYCKLRVSFKSKTR